MWYDEEEDILGIQITKDKYWKSIELPNGIIIDISKKGIITGMEVLRASKVFRGDMAEFKKLKNQVDEMREIAK